MPYQQVIKNLSIDLVKRIDGPAAFAALIAIVFGVLSKDILYTGLFFILITIIYFTYKYFNDKDKLSSRNIKVIKEDYAEKIGNLSIHFRKYRSQKDVCDALYNEALNILYSIGSPDKADGLRRRLEESRPPPKEEP